MGPTQRPSGRGRGWRADDHAFGRRESAASGFSIRYAGDRRRMESTSSNHRRRPSGSCAGSRRSLRRRDAISSETGCLRAQRNDAVDLPFGVGLLGISRPSGSGMRPRCFLREGPEPTRPISIGSLRGARSGGTEAQQSSGCQRAGSASGDLRVDARHRTHGARQSRDTLPSLDVSGRGTPKRGWTREAKRPARLGGAKRAAASGNESIQSPWEHRAGRGGNAA